MSNLGDKTTILLEQMLYQAGYLLWLTREFSMEALAEVDRRAGSQEFIQISRDRDGRPPPMTNFNSSQWQWQADSHLE